MSWWDDDDVVQPSYYELYDPDDPWLPVARPVRYSIYGAHWDPDKKDWVCICPDHRRQGKCRHTRSYRYTEYLDVKEEYL